MLGSRRNLISILTISAAALTLQTSAALAGAPGPERELPQSIRLEHSDTLEHLTLLSHRPGSVGAVARDALVLVKRHVAREREYILPPLTLLPYLAEGKATPDMAWAVAMSDRVRADREVIFQEHTQLTTLMTRLRDAGLRAHDREAVAFAQSAVVDSLNDLEIQEPAVLMIGDVLRARLAAR